MYFNMFSYMDDAPTHTVAGSTLPLVNLPRKADENEYNPFEHRKLTHPTS